MRRSTSMLVFALSLGCGSSAELVAPSESKPLLAVAATHEAPEPAAAEPAAAEPAVEAAEEPDHFRFPADPAGELVGQLLRPSQRIPGALDDAPSTRRPLPPPRSLENPQPPLTPAPADLPRRVLEPVAVSAKPRGVTEGVPLAGYRPDPAAPVRAALPTGKPVALPSVDVNLPAPLPALNPLRAERVPTDDPTTAGSRQAALAAPPPLRLNPVPFTPENLPDPFTNAATVRLRQPPAESNQPRR